MEDKIKCIYGIRDNRDNTFIYVGQTVNFYNRKSNHFNTKEKPIDLYMFEQGRDNFEMIIIEKLNEDISKEEMKNKEQNYLEILNLLFPKKLLNQKRSGNICSNMKEYYREYRKTDKYKEYRKQYDKEYYKTDKYREHKRQYYHKKNKELENL